MKEEKEKCITRLQLAQKMGVSSKTIKRYLDRYKDDISKLDPYFTDRYLISPKIAHFLHERFWPTDPNNSDND